MKRRKSRTFRRGTPHSVVGACHAFSARLKEKPLPVKLHLHAGSTAEGTVSLEETPGEKVAQLVVNAQDSNLFGLVKREHRHVFMVGELERSRSTHTAFLLRSVKALTKGNEVLKEEMLARSLSLIHANEAVDITCDTKEDCDHLGEWIDAKWSVAMIQKSFRGNPRIALALQGKNQTLNEKGLYDALAVGGDGGRGGAAEEGVGALDGAGFGVLPVLEGEELSLLEDALLYGIHVTHHDLSLGGFLSNSSPYVLRYDCQPSTSDGYVTLEPSYGEGETIKQPISELVQVGGVPSAHGPTAGLLRATQGHPEQRAGAVSLVFEKKAMDLTCSKKTARELVLFFSAARGFTRAAPQLSSLFGFSPSSPGGSPEEDPHVDRQSVEPWREIGYLDDGDGGTDIGGHRSRPLISTAVVATSGGGDGRERSRVRSSGGSPAERRYSASPTFSSRFREGIGGGGAEGFELQRQLSASSGFGLQMLRDESREALVGMNTSTPLSKGGELQRQMSASSGFGLQMLRAESREALVGRNTSTPLSKTAAQQRSWSPHQEKGAAAAAATARAVAAATGQRFGQGLEPMREEPLTRSEPSRIRKSGDAYRGGGRAGEGGSGNGSGGERTPRGRASGGLMQPPGKRTPPHSERDRNHLHLFQADPTESEAPAAARGSGSTAPPPLARREKPAGGVSPPNSGRSSGHHDRKERRDRRDDAHLQPGAGTAARRGTHDGSSAEREHEHRERERDAKRLPTRKPKEITGPTRGSPQRRGTTGDAPNYGGASSTPFAPRISTVFASAPAAAAAAVAEGGDFVRRHLHLKKAFPGGGGGGGSSGEARRGSPENSRDDEDRRRRRSDPMDRSKHSNSRGDRANRRSASPVDRHNNAPSPVSRAEYLSDSWAGRTRPDSADRRSRAGTAARGSRGGPGAPDSRTTSSGVHHGGRSSRPGSGTRESRVGSTGVDHSGRGSISRASAAAGTVAPPPLPFTSSAEVAISAMKAQLAVDAISPDGSSSREARRERRRFGGIERTVPARSRSPTDSSYSPVDRRRNTGEGGHHAQPFHTASDEDARGRRASSPPPTSPTAATPAGGRADRGTRHRTGFRKVLRGGGDKLKQLATLKKGTGAGTGTGSNSTSVSSTISGDGLDASPVGTGQGRWHRHGHRFFTAPRANSGGVDDFTAGNVFRSAPGAAVAAKSPSRP